MVRCGSSNDLPAVVRGMCKIRFFCSPTSLAVSSSGQEQGGLRGSSKNYIFSRLRERQRKAKSGGGPGAGTDEVGVAVVYLKTSNSCQEFAGTLTAGLVLVLSPPTCFLVDAQEVT